MALGVDSGQASGVTRDEIVGPREDDAASSHSLDEQLVPRSEPSPAESVDGKSRLILGADPRPPRMPGLLYRCHVR